MTLVAACGSTGDAPLTQESCAAIEQSWRDALAAIDRSCSTANDCVQVGGEQDCDGEPVLGGCFGTSVNATALAMHPEVAMYQQQFQPCIANGCSWADCCFDDYSHAACVNYVCTSQSYNACLQPSPDASLDAPPPDGGA